MSATATQQNSIGDQLKAEISKAFSLPVTEAFKVLRVAALFGISASQTPLDKLAELKRKIFRKAAKLWEPVAKKAVDELTQKDLQILREAGEKLEALKGINKNSVDASGTTVSDKSATKLPGGAKEKKAPLRVKKRGLSTEQRLRAENRIQDDRAILKKLGFKGRFPKIPAALIEECARTDGTLVLKFSTTILDYQKKLIAALGEESGSLGLNRIDDKTLKTINEVPAWINVPNAVRDKTLGLSKANALKLIPGSQTCDPMDTVLMLGYNNLQLGQQMPGFTNKLTFTSQENTLVGSDVSGISVVSVFSVSNDAGYDDVGLAPRLRRNQKKLDR